jgi:hypothetical protein
MFRPWFSTEGQTTAICRMAAFPRISSDAGERLQAMEWEEEDQAKPGRAWRMAAQRKAKFAQVVPPNPGAGACCPILPGRRAWVLRSDGRQPKVGDADVKQ